MRKQTPHKKKNAACYTRAHFNSGKSEAANIIICFVCQRCTYQAHDIQGLVRLAFDSHKEIPNL